MPESPGSAERPLRVCYFGTYRANYTRSQILLAGLRSRPNVQIEECHVQLWQGVEDRVEQASGGWRRPQFWARVVAAYWQLIKRHRHTPYYDVMLIGYPGQFDAYLARLLTWWRGKPAALDILMSLHLVAEERGLTEAHQLTAKLIYLLEKGGLKLPDLLISENDAYQGYYCRKFSLDPRRFRQVPHGADDRVFYPRPLERPDHPFTVTYHGSYLPSHGMEAILGAATQLKDNSLIQFHFYGDGPLKPQIAAAATEAGLGNVVFHGFVDSDDLLDALARSHVCLGVFGTTRQSYYTIQNKVWEGLAMGRPVISGDSDIVRQSLVAGEEIYLVPRSDPQALAAAIVELCENREQAEAMAARGHQRYLAGNSIAAIGRETEQALRSLLPV